MNGSENHLLHPMQYHLNGAHISEVTKYLAESPCVTTHAIELPDPFDATHIFIIPLQLSSATSYFYEYKNEDIPEFLLTAEEPPWEPSTNNYSERENQILDHQGQISIPYTAARGPVFVSTVISYSLAYDAADVMDNDNLVMSLSAQIQISIALIGIVRKPSVEPIILAKQWGIAPEKSQLPQLREGLRPCSTHHCQDDSEPMIGIVINITLHIFYSPT